MAGALSTRENWLAFDDEWKAALYDFEQLPFFHMSEYETGIGVYEDWQARGVKYDRFDRLLKIIEKYVLFSVGSAIGLDLCEKYYRVRADETALGMAATRCFVAMPQYFLAGGDPDEEFAYTFEQGDTGWGRLEAVYNQIYSDSGTRRQARLGTKVSVEKKKFPPLQVADIFAYEMWKQWARESGLETLSQRYSNKRLKASIPTDWLSMDEGFLKMWIAQGKS